MFNKLCFSNENAVLRIIVSIL
jgi:hypothetical protein